MKTRPRPLAARLHFGPRVRFSPGGFFCQVVRIHSRRGIGIGRLPGRGVFAVRGRPLGQPGFFRAARRSRRRGRRRSTAGWKQREIGVLGTSGRRIELLFNAARGPPSPGGTGGRQSAGRLLPVRRRQGGADFRCVGGRAGGGTASGRNHCWLGGGHARFGRLRSVAGSPRRHRAAVRGSAWPGGRTRRGTGRFSADRAAPSRARSGSGRENRRSIELVARAGRASSRAASEGRGSGVVLDRGLCDPEANRARGRAGSAGPKSGNGRRRPYRRAIHGERRYKPRLLERRPAGDAARGRSGSRRQPGAGGPPRNYTGRLERTRRQSRSPRYATIGAPSLSFPSL